MAIQHNNLAIVVDPGDASPVLAILTQLNLTLSAILITHHHWDHTNGIADLLRHYSVPVYGPAHDKIAEITHPLQQGDTLHLADTTFHIIEIPGHTLDHIAYYNQQSLFCGDTLFASGCGRLFEGSAEQMYHSLQTLAALPDEMNIYCTHEYTLANLHFAQTVEPNSAAIAQRIKWVQHLRDKNLPSLPSNMAVEKQANPFLRCQQSTVISAVEQHSKQNLHNSVDVFRYLRRWKDSF